MNNIKNILKPKSTNDVVDEINKMHPYLFISKFKYLDISSFYKKIQFKKRLLYFLVVLWPKYFRKFYWYYWFAWTACIWTNIIFKKYFSPELHKTLITISNIGFIVIVIWVLVLYIGRYLDKKIANWLLQKEFTDLITRAYINDIINDIRIYNTEGEEYPD